MSDSQRRRQQLAALWDAAIAAVSGRQAVLNALAADTPFTPDLVIAVGKAAAGMCAGALERYPDCEALVVTKYGHGDAFPGNVETIEAGHPIPDQNSLAAGRLLLARVRAMPKQSRVLMLVSGGASALAEALPENVSLTDLQAMTDAMIAGGKTIGEINARRKQTSLIKDGKLVAAFSGREIRVYAISDVEGDRIEIIGSGIGDCCSAGAGAAAKIIASNTLARAHAAQQARQLGLTLRVNEETLYGDLFELAPSIAARLAPGKPGVYLWGGEPTVVLPENPGRGGRNQSLALALAEHIAGRDDISLLVAGTDGTDGPTSAAGGIVDGSTWKEAATARAALQNADAGSYLEAQQALFVTGPTNTNVMDLAIAIVS